MRQPAFWGEPVIGLQGVAAVLPSVLTPVAWAVARWTARRVARPGWHAPVPVICCGNAGVGGAGKTTLALDIVARLHRRGVAIHVLTRGYGGQAGGVTRVDSERDDARRVGDEALLLARCAPTWVGADRAATAKAAVAAGAQALVMDDGLQNPTLAKTCSLLVIDGAVGFGNGRVMPAGPLREPVTACAARVQAAVLMGPDTAGAARMLPIGLPLLTATLVPGAGIADLVGRRVVAFAGIGRPEKFFGMLETAGVNVAARLAFADHHPYTARQLAAIHAQATKRGAVPVTTPKDFARLPAAWRAGIRAIGVSLVWADEPSWERLLHDTCGDCAVQQE